MVPSLPLSPSQLKEGDSGHGGYARAFAFFSEAHLTSSVEIVWLGAPACFKMAVTAAPQLAATGSTGCMVRLGAALRTLWKRSISADPTVRPWPWSHAGPN